MHKRPLLTVCAYPSGVIEVDQPTLLLSILGTLRTQVLCSHFSFTFTSRYVTPAWTWPHISPHAWNTVDASNSIAMEWMRLRCNPKQREIKVAS